MGGGGGRTNTCLWEVGHKVQMAPMQFKHNQGIGHWILLHVVWGPWTSFVAVLDKGQWNIAVCRRHSVYFWKQPLNISENVFFHKQVKASKSLFPNAEGYLGWLEARVMFSRLLFPPRMIRPDLPAFRAANCSGVSFITLRTERKRTCRQIYFPWESCGFGSESGSGSTGSTCFWASWIRILLSLSKNSFISIFLWLLFDFLSMKNDVNVPFKKLFF